MSDLSKKRQASERRMFSLLIEQDLLWRWGIVAAHEKKKKKDIILSLLVPYVNSKYATIFSKNATKTNSIDAADTISEDDLEGPKNLIDA